MEEAVEAEQQPDLRAPSATREESRLKTWKTRGKNSFSCLDLRLLCSSIEEASSHASLILSSGLCTFWLVFARRHSSGVKFLISWVLLFCIWSWEREVTNSFVGLSFNTTAYYCRRQEERPAKNCDCDWIFPSCIQLEKKDQFAKHFQERSRTVLLFSCNCSFFLLLWSLETRDVNDIPSHRFSFTDLLLSVPHFQLHWIRTKKRVSSPTISFCARKRGSSLVIHTQILLLTLSSFFLGQSWVLIVSAKGEAGQRDVFLQREVSGEKIRRAEGKLSKNKKTQSRAACKLRPSLGTRNETEGKVVYFAIGFFFSSEEERSSLWLPWFLVSFDTFSLSRQETNTDEDTIECKKNTAGQFCGRTAVLRQWVHACVSWFSYSFLHEDFSVHEDTSFYPQFARLVCQRCIQSIENVAGKRSLRWKERGFGVEENEEEKNFCMAFSFSSILVVHLLSNGKYSSDNEGQRPRLEWGINLYSCWRDDGKMGRKTWFRFFLLFYCPLTFSYLLCHYLPLLMTRVVSLKGRLLFRERRTKWRQPSSEGYPETSSQWYFLSTSKVVIMGGKNHDHRETRLSLSVMLMMMASLFSQRVSCWCQWRFWFFISFSVIDLWCNSIKLLLKGFTTKRKKESERRHFLTNWRSRSSS